MSEYWKYWYVWICLALTACHQTPLPIIYTEDRGCEVAVVTEKEVSLINEWISRMTSTMGNLIEIPQVMLKAKSMDVLITGACYQERIIHPLTKTSLQQVSFGTFIKCRIDGYVYNSKQDVPTLTRQDHCPIHSEVALQIDGNKVMYDIILNSDYNWVKIPIPNTIEGNTEFWYVWGSDHAYFHGIAINVDSGRIAKG